MCNYLNGMEMKLWELSTRNLVNNKTSRLLLLRLHRNIQLRLHTHGLRQGTHESLGLTSVD